MFYIKKTSIIATRCYRLLRSWRISENMLQLMHFSVYVVYILPENWPLLYRNNDIFALCTHAKIIRGHISLQENAQFVALSTCGLCLTVFVFCRVCRDIISAREP